MTLEEIKAAVSALTVGELTDLQIWLEEFAVRRFDEAIERDAKTGKLDRLAEAALAKEAARRLALLGGSQPQARAAPRRRFPPET